MRGVPAEMRSAFDAFRRVVEHVERAKAALTDAAPTARLPGRPLADALFDFEEELVAAQAEMAGWRTPEVDGAWRLCERAITDARANAERVRLAGDAPSGFEALIDAIAGLLAPLDAFVAAADRFRELRSRRRAR